MKNNIICDIDGTLADLTHRLHFVRGPGKKDWDAFFGAIQHDSPHEDVINVLNAAMAFNRNSRVFLATGRPERTRWDTENWLLNNAPLAMSAGHRIAGIFMRANGDRREDFIVKCEIAEELHRKFGVTPENTLFVLDDRDQVVRMWRGRGFRVLQVAHGDF